MFDIHELADTIQAIDIAQEILEPGIEGKDEDTQSFLDRAIALREKAEALFNTLNTGV